MSLFKRFLHIKKQTISFEAAAAQERRSLFLRYINLSWLIFGVATLVAFPLFPDQRPVFLFLLAVIFPTYLIIRFLNSSGQIVLAGILFTFLVNFGFYSLFIFLAYQMGAYQAFETQSTVWMLMGLAVLFAGALIDKWAAPILAFFNTVLLVATRVTLAPEAEPRPSVLVLWWILAVTVWLYERNLAQVFMRIWTELSERRQTEKALEDNRKLAEELYELTPDALLTVNLHGKITRVNAQAISVFGYPREDLLDKPIEMLIPQRYHSHHEKERQKYFENPRLRPMGKGLELFGVKQDGSEFPVEISLSPIHIGEENFVTAAIRDVTERKYAETALRESEERFRKIFNSSPIAICITTLEEGRLLDANNAYWDITGYSRETSIGHTAEELKMWDAPQERVEFVRELRQKQSISNPNDHFFHTDGSLKNVISFYELILIGEQECILAMFYDMSVQKQLEVERENLIRQLEAQNAETETLRESFASIVGTLEFTEITQHILDQIRRVIPYDSASIWRVEGNLQKFISGRNLPPELSTGEMTFIVNDTNSGSPILNGEVPYILNNNVQEELKDFQEHPHNYVNSWLAIPLKTRGKIIGLIALDGKEKNQFTKHHAQLAVTFANQVVIALENSQLFSRLQNELLTREKLIKELESKNAELERFFYTASHDLKSPIVTIRGFLGYLEEDVKTGNSERLRRDIERINGATNKMYNLLNDLLELSRVGRLINPSEHIPFNEIISEARLLSADRLSEKKITVQVDPNLPSVYGDRIRLVEVVQNLIDNAANFMGDQPKPLIEIGARQQGNQWVFFVSDNGIGISSQYHERIFNLFDKLDSSSTGTGIGLAIVRRIIEFHGGKVWVESEAGEGSTFYFTLG